MKKLTFSIFLIMLLFTKISATSVDGDIINQQEKIKIKAGEITDLQEEINDLDQMISKVEQDIKNSEIESINLEEKNTKLEIEIDKLNEEISANSESNSMMLSYLQTLNSGNGFIDVLFSSNGSSSLKSAYAFNILISEMADKINETVIKMKKVEEDKILVEKNVEKINKNIKSAIDMQNEIKDKKADIVAKQDNLYLISDELNRELVSLETQQQSEIQRQKQNAEIAKNPGTSQVTGSKKDWMKQAGIDEADFGYVDYIVNVESGWDYTATNPFSGAYGLCQALPGSKMQSAGSDWQTNPVTQLVWCESYAVSRYGTWENAYNFWHANHWW